MVDYVVPHNPEWKNGFRQEATAITEALSGLAIDLHHIGSTAIDGILAKPIIDLLGVVPDVNALDGKANAFEDLGYEIMGAYGIEGRRYFRKVNSCLLYTSPSPRDRTRSRMPSSA